MPTTTPFAKLLAANTTANSGFSAAGSLATITTAPPAGSALIDMTKHQCRNVLLRFFGVGADGNAATARVSLVNQAGTVFVITPVCEYRFTLSTAPGVAGGNAGAGDLFADTLARSNSVGVDNVTDVIVSPAGLNVPASLLVDPRDSAYLLVELQKGAATSVNAEWRGVN